MKVSDEHTIGHLAMGMLSEMADIVRSSPRNGEIEFHYELLCDFESNALCMVLVHINNNTLRFEFYDSYLNISWSRILSAVPNQWIIPPETSTEELDDLLTMYEVEYSDPAFNFENLLNVIDTATGGKQDGKQE